MSSVGALESNLGNIWLDFLESEKYLTLFLDLALGVRPVITDGDAGSSGHFLKQGGLLLLANTFGLSGILLIGCLSPFASLLRPPETSVCRPHTVTAVSGVDVTEVSSVELRLTHGLGLTH